MLHGLRYAVINVLDAENSANKERDTDMTQTAAALQTLAFLENKAIDNNFRIIAWTLHDAIVDHKRRDGITQSEASVLINAMRKLFPVTLTKREHYYNSDKSDEANSTEYMFLAQQENADRYVWCSIYLPDDPENDYCETCIADEQLSNLAYAVSNYL